jgi:hypothetical protein
LFFLIFLSISLSVFFLIIRIFIYHFYIYTRRLLLYTSSCRYDIFRIDKLCLQRSY